MAARGFQCILLIGLVVGLVSSCTGPEKEEKEAGVYYTAWIPPGQVPPALEEIGNLAVNVIDLAGAGAWPQVLAYTGDISDRWNDYKHPTVVPPTYPRRGATLLYGELDAAVSRLREAAATRNTYQTMRAANDVDAAAIELMEYFNPPMPGDLRRLAVLERRILVDCWEGKLDNVSDTLIDVRRAWGRVRPIIVDRAGAEVALAFDDNLADQQAALNGLEAETVGDYAENALLALHEMQQWSY